MNYFITAQLLLPNNIKTRFYFFRICEKFQKGTCQKTEKSCCMLKPNCSIAVEPLPAAAWQRMLPVTRAICSRLTRPCYSMHLLAMVLVCTVPKDLLYISWINHVASSAIPMPSESILLELPRVARSFIAIASLAWNPPPLCTAPPPRGTWRVGFNLPHFVIDHQVYT